MVGVGGSNPLVPTTYYILNINQISQKNMSKENRENINQILNKKQNNPQFALFEFAFRPFFLFPVIFAIVHITLWLFIYSGKFSLGLNSISSFLWHGHEMVFGYVSAVIIGFLLTAVTNWTGKMTMTGKQLMLLFSLWLVARIMFMVPGETAFIVAMACDLLFLTLALVDFIKPIIETKNKRQFGFIAKLVIIFIANVLFYLGAFGILENGMHYGVYLGFYIALSIVFALGRRVIPFFISRGINPAKEIQNPKWIDSSSLVLIGVFSVYDTFFTADKILAAISLVLFIVHSVRLYNWHRKAIWGNSLLWILWVSYLFLTLGFLLKFISALKPDLVNPFLALHCFSYAGIGLITIGMMARVTLGHTGRSIYNPPKLVKPAFIILIIGSFFRVIAPIIIPASHNIFIHISVTLWILAFLLFVFSYAKMLISQRIDGKKG